MTVPGKRTGRAPRRQLSLCILLLFLAGQILGGLHHSFVQHHICEHDGQLAHGDHGHASHLPLTLAAETEVAHNCGDEDLHSDPESAHHDRDELPSLSGDDRIAHAHHCSIPRASEVRRTVEPQVKLAPLPRFRARQPLSVEPQVLGGCTDVVLLAPKQSPPFAG